MKTDGEGRHSNAQMLWEKKSCEQYVFRKMNCLSILYIDNKQDVVYTKCYIYTVSGWNL